MTREPREDERARQWMMMALDGEITPEERRELERLLESDPALKKEWDTMSRVKSIAKDVLYAEPPREIWDDYWNSVYNRTERGIGWIFASIGAIVIGCFGFYEFVRAFLQEADAPWLLKGGVLALGFGLVILAVSVIRERIFTHRRDPYKEVQR